MKLRTGQDEEIIPDAKLRTGQDAGGDNGNRQYASRQAGLVETFSAAHIATCTDGGGVSGHTVRSFADRLVEAVSAQCGSGLPPA